MRRLKWLDRANKTARLSEHRKQKMAAVIVKGNRVLSSACNGSKYGRHAEIRAIARAGCDLKGATLFVARYPWRLSKPCSMCFDAIKDSGIDEVVFINEEGEAEWRDVRLEAPEDYAKCKKVAS